MDKDSTLDGASVVRTISEITVLAEDVGRGFDQAMFENNPQMPEGARPWQDLTPEARRQVIKAIEDTVRGNNWLASVDWEHLYWAGALTHILAVADEAAPLGGSKMDAYVVDRQVVRHLLVAALNEGQGQFTWKDYAHTDRELTLANATEVGQMLFDQCIGAVARWYPDTYGGPGDPLPNLPSGDDQIYTHEPAPTGFVPDLAQTLVSLNEYTSECAADPDWDTSPTKAFVAALKEAVFDRMLHTLAGYATAKRGPREYPEIPAAIPLAGGDA